MHSRITRTASCLGAAAALTLGTLVAMPGQASATTPTPTTVTFTGEPVGSKPNGYATAAQPGVHFWSTGAAGLDVADLGNQSNGQAIQVTPDDTSALEIRLTGVTTHLALAFGNDDPSVVDGTDQAELRLYRNATLVGQVDVNVNANDAMDQRISYGSGRLFNRAVFQYVDAAGAPKNLIEVVDDVEVAPICTKAGNTGNNRLVGTSGPDVICGDSGNDRIIGGGGNDLIYPGPGWDSTSGGNGNDTVLDTVGRDHVGGGRGNDDLRGGNGPDTLSGGPGRDRLSGGSGRDHCNGGSGRDRAVSCEVRRLIP
jgi:hypothetical protein